MTYFGVALAIMGMFFAVQKKPQWAILCLIICGVCDLFDGMVARRCKRSDDEKEFGVQIDSLADMINFAAFPVVIGIATGFDQWFMIMIYILYVLAAITRLGFFNLLTVSKTAEPGFYKGLPVTYAALIFTIAWVLSRVIERATAKDLFEVIFLIAMAFTAILFVVNIRIAKPRGIAYVFLGLLAIAMATYVIMLGA